MLKVKMVCVLDLMKLKNKYNQIFYVIVLIFSYDRAVHRTNRITPTDSRLFAEHTLEINNVKKKRNYNCSKIRTENST
jgi:hypothetical protein